VPGADAAKGVLDSAAQQGPVVYLAVVIVMVAVALGGVVIYGLWRAAKWAAPRVDEGFRAHVELMGVMKADKVADAAHRQRLEDLHQDHVEAMRKLDDHVRGIHCRGLMPRPGDAG